LGFPSVPKNYNRQWREGETGSVKKIQTIAKTFVQFPNGTTLDLGKKKGGLVIKSSGGEAWGNGQPKTNERVKRKKMEDRQNVQLKRWGKKKSDRQGREKTKRSYRVAGRRVGLSRGIQGHKKNRKKSEKKSPGTGDTRVREKNNKEKQKEQQKSTIRKRRQEECND